MINLDIVYQDNINNISIDNLNGFFVGWGDSPNPSKHLEILENSDFKILAINKTDGQVIGFINAITDKVLTAYIPLLEVLPTFKGRGVGKVLVAKMFKKLENFYMIDICCDESLEGFYQKFEMVSVKGMIKRNYKFQKGL